MTDPAASPRPFVRPRIDLPLADTLAGYDRWAATYDATDNPMVAATAWVLRQRPFAVAGCDVLELGCGTGRHAELLLAAGARSFTGVDGSAGMLEVAKRRVTDSRSTWLQGQLDALPVAAAAFDCALIVLVFEHVRDLHPVFAELARALRPGGRVRILDIHADLVAGGTNAHFAAGEAEVRFASTAHELAEFDHALARAGLVLGDRLEFPAAGELLQAVPRLGKHQGRRVLVDLAATRR